MAKIELMNSIFDRSNDNVLLFKNKEERESYFNIQEKTVFENINFIANDLISTKIVLNILGALPLFKLLNRNYCRVIEQGESIYYFIDSSRQLDGGLIELSLQCDVLMTYFYDCKNLNGFVSRSHLDRFFNVSGSQFFKYNFKLDSPLFESEGINFSKRASFLTPLIMEYQNGTMAAWIEENISHWIYVFLDTQTYKLYGPDGTEYSQVIPSIKYANSESNQTDSHLTVLCYPIYKKGSKLIYAEGDVSGEKYTAIWNTDGFKAFLSAQGEGYARVKTIKASFQSPFSSNELSSFKISDNGNLIFNSSVTSGNWGSVWDLGLGEEGDIYSSELIRFHSGASDHSSVIASIQWQNLENIIYISQRPMYTDSFLIDNIDNSVEPKLYNEEVSSYRIFLGGQMKYFPVSKSAARPRFFYKEPFTPDITKSILILNTENTLDPIYDYDITKKDFNGLVFQIDLSQWYVTDQLDIFLANNKNYLQIFNNDQKKQVASGVSQMAGAGAGALLSLTNPNPVAGATGAVSGVISAVNTGVNTVIQNKLNEENFYLTLDNMSASIDQLSAINSNLPLITSVNQLRIYIELLEPIPFEKQIFIDKMKMFGYFFGKIANINELISTRTFFNYIEATVYDIDGEFSEKIKDSIKAIFEKGVRFWHFDNWTGKIDYSLNNKERSLK